MVGRQNRDQQEAEDELGEFLPEERGLIPYRLSLAPAGPIDGISEHHKSDHGVACGFDEDRELACGIGIERASGGAYGEERSEFGLEAEEPPKKSHEGDGTSDLDGHQDEADSTELENVPEKKSRAEQDDAHLEPELVGGHAGAEDFRNADRVGNNQAEDDGPQDVFDIGKRPVMGLRVGADVLLQQFAGVADAGEQNHTGDRSEEHTSELQSQSNLVCRLLLEKKKKIIKILIVLQKKKKIQHKK